MAMDAALRYWKDLWNDWRTAPPKLLIYAAGCFALLRFIFSDLSDSWWGIAMLALLFTSDSKKTLTPILFFLGAYFIAETAMTLWPATLWLVAATCGLFIVVDFLRNYFFEPLFDELRQSDGQHPRSTT